MVSNGSTTAKMYGNVDEGLMTLAGRVKETVSEGDWTENEYDEHVPWIMMLYADSERGFPLTMSQSSIYFAYTTPRTSARSLFLFLQPLQHSARHFKRFGLGMVIWK